MNILFFVESGLGVGALLCDQVTSIHNYNPDTIAVASTKEQEPNLINKLSSKGIETIILEGLENHKQLLFHAKILRKLLKNRKFDVIHVQTNWELLLTRISLLGLNYKPQIIYTIHSFRNNKGWIKKTIAKYIIIVSLALFCDRVIAPSKYLEKEFSIIQKKLYSLPLGIDDDYIKRNFVVPPGNLVMIYPAAFRQGKRQEMIIDALYKYIRATGVKDVKLILPGVGGTMDACICQVKESGLEDYVEFPGYCSKSELLRHYDRSNVLICSSISETYSQIIAEGLALGKCIITTPVGIALDIIDDNSTGFVFSTEDELVSRLIAIGEKKEQLLYICKMNYSNRMKYSWMTISKQYLEFLALWSKC